MKQVLLFLLMTFWVMACTSQNGADATPIAAITNTPSRTALPTQPPTASFTPTAIPSATPIRTPTQTPTPLPTATPTQKPTKTPVPTATVFASSEPLLTQLEEQGYVNEPIYRFEMQPSSGATYFSNQGQFGRMNFGGPAFDDPVPPESLTTRLPSGQVYTYRQYMTPDFTTCQLLFFVSEGDDNRLIANIDIADLNDRIKDVVTSLQAEPTSPLFCLPYGWHDVNNNGRPDMPVTILYANNYSGGEVRIFEISEEGNIVDLTAELPGPVYHWEFQPTNSSLLVVDSDWGAHDCLYPDSPFGFWLYDWDGEAYVDMTDKFSFSEYISFLESLLEPGRPFYPEFDIGPLVSLLLTYDYSGQRELGWQKFLELADMSNWPGTDPEAAAWLQADVTHFTSQYEAGLAFTPNNANCTP